MKKAEYLMIEINDKLNTGGNIVIDEENKNITVVIWGTVLHPIEQPKKIGENKYQQRFENGLILDFSYSIDGKDLIIDYRFEDVKKSTSKAKPEEKKANEGEEIFEIFISKPKEIIYTKQIYEVGEIVVNDKSWQILEKTYCTNIKREVKKISAGEYDVSITSKGINCQGEKDNFEIVKGWNTNNMIIGKTMITGKNFKERSRYDGELLIEQGDILLDSIISEIKKSSKGKKIKLVVFEEKMEKNEKLSVQIIIYGPKGLGTFYGHAELAIGDTIYSYGRYDPNSIHGSGGTLGDGVLVVGKKEDIIEEATEDREVYIYELETKKGDGEKIEKFYNKLIKDYGVPWIGKNDSGKNKKYKFTKKSKYSGYEFVGGDNCSTMVIEALKAGIGEKLYKPLKYAVSPAMIMRALELAIANDKINPIHKSKIIKNYYTESKKEKK